MPVLDQATSNNYTGNGVTTVFAYTFRLLDEADVLVTVDGVTKALTTHYTVSGVGASGGGNITFLSAPANASEVVIQRDMAYSREADYQENGDLLAETLDEDLDRAVMLVQQIRGITNRAITIPVADTTGTTVELPVAASRADKALIFDADGNVTVSTDDYEDQLTNVTAQAAAAAASAASASSSASSASSSASAASTSASTASTQASNASTSATNAATSASNAATSASAAQTAETNAETAETNAETALADALAIYGSIAAVQTAETNAAASASAAQTAETNAETAETNAAASAAAALVSENAAEAAYDASIAIYGSLGAVQAAQASASASATAASDSATTAIAQAASAASSALSAASVVDQDLSAIDKTVFAATIVDAFIYDTQKDSDGGAWRHRCGHTSWENETLSGNWLGSAANETAARAISGATTGSMYYDTTAAAFYTLNAGSGKTVTYRGNTRKFPAKVLITVEAGRVVLWDLTAANVPMWMVFFGSSNNMLYTPSTNRNVAMLNGTMVVANPIVLPIIKFPADKCFMVHSTAPSTGPYKGNISERNAAKSWGVGTEYATIVNSGVNDVAMTVLPGAPVDVATGLPIPVIDVFTDAGTSRINSDGTVADLVDTAGDDHYAGCILASGDSVALNSTNGNVDIYKLSNTLADTLTPDRTYDQATVPALLEAVDAGDKVVAMRHRLAIGQDNGVNVLIENPASIAAGMIAYVTKDYTSGWLPGDIRGAWLADTVAETVTGTELVTNGTFATDITGWTNSSAVGGAIAWNAGGALDLTYTTGVAIAVQVLTLVVGKTYTLTMSKSGTGTLVVRGGLGTGESQAFNTSNQTVTFTATHAAQYITIYNTSAGTLTLDNISCKLADVDRSVKAKGLQINGSLTKAAVASGAQLMGYSGFSAANYLEQPYNSDLDFGTGDFCIQGWLTEAPNSAIEYLFNRDSATPGKAIRLWVSVAGYLVFEIYDGTTTRTATGTVAVDTSVRQHVLCTYSAGTLTIYVNGVSYATATGAALLTLTNASAVTRIGRDVAGSYPATNANLALWRAGATAPSAEQIKHIYETEKPLFEANSNCLLAGSSNAITALAYDDETDLLHVGTSYGRSTFKGLTRVASEATAIGAITALSASGGFIAQGGASGADIYVPAYLLREELSRRAEQAAKFGQALVAHDFTATASQTTFTLPVGWEIVAVYQQGSIKRETTSWSKSFDGFKWSAVLGTGATVSDWITILAKRTVQ